MPVPASRLRRLNTQPVRADGEYVLYWMTSARRVVSNFALDRAVEVARANGRPLLIVETLECDDPWANDRLHRFAIEGMAHNASALAETAARYWPYVESSPRAGADLVAALATRACAVVTDDYPAGTTPDMLTALASRLPVACEAVDSNGILPMRLVDTPFATALGFRAHLQRVLRDHLADWPLARPLEDLPRRQGADLALAPEIGQRWPATPVAALADPGPLIAGVPIDHGVPRAPMRGGTQAGLSALRDFITNGLDLYVERHSHPDLRGTSRLSPYLRYGHVGAHDVFSAVMTHERWTSRQLGARAGGRREGWWGVSPGAESFLDQVVTWRELGFNMCATRPSDYDNYASLPAWARATLERHAKDPRAPEYDRPTLEQAATHDAVWNAAQRQLLRDGWMHNYLRMLWGKKILEWSPSPEAALEAMIQIMNRHAVDGRDPNSYSGYCWTLGRYDRPWGPERPVFGTVRYMSSDNAVRKLKMRTFLEEYGPGTLPF